MPRPPAGIVALRFFRVAGLRVANAAASAVRAFLLAPTAAGAVSAAAPAAAALLLFCTSAAAGITAGPNAAELRRRWCVFMVLGPPEAAAAAAGVATALRPAAGVIADAGVALPSGERAGCLRTAGVLWSAAAGLGSLCLLARPAAGRCKSAVAARLGVGAAGRAARFADAGVEPEGTASC